MAFPLVLKGKKCLHININVSHMMWVMIFMRAGKWWLKSIISSRLYFLSLFFTLRANWIFRLQVIFLLDLNGFPSSFFLFFFFISPPLLHFIHMVLLFPITVQPTIPSLIIAFLLCIPRLLFLTNPLCFISPPIHLPFKQYNWHFLLIYPTSYRFPWSLLSLFLNHFLFIYYYFWAI